MTVYTSSTHRPMMLAEVVDALSPQPGDVAVDCTIGSGAHARAILERIQPGGLLVGLDVDLSELPHTEARLRAGGFGPDACRAHHANFANLPAVLEVSGVRAADVILVDLGVSSMQIDNPARGFSRRVSGPLDMRMDQSKGEPASRLIERLNEAELAAVLREHADEPHASVIARVLKSTSIATAQQVDRLVRAAVSAENPVATKAELKMSVRRTLQALRIAVNDELAALDSLLNVLPSCLAPGGRVAILTFHSGEDRRVKKSFQAGHRAGLYSAIARDVIRSRVEETRADRRAMAAKLRWAVRSDGPTRI